VSDILIINMWMNDIGRHAAANLGLLQVIFEVNLKLFEQSSAKKLMFCIRDFVESGSNRDFLQKALKKDIDDIWAKMYKPDKFKDSSPEQFFNFEFVMLPHKVYAEQGFIEKVKELKDRMVVGSEDSLFLQDSDQKQVPLDGMPVFIEQSWAMIRDQKELNLPDQRKLVADFRCNEFKVEAIDLVRDEIEKLQVESDGGNMEESKFSAVCTGILKKAEDYYVDGAAHYENGVFSKVGKELKNSLLEFLYKCFDT